MNLGVCFGLMHLAGFSLYLAGPIGDFGPLFFGEFGMTRSFSNFFASISLLAPIKFNYEGIRVLQSILLL